MAIDQTLGAVGYRSDVVRKARSSVVRGRTERQPPTLADALRVGALLDDDGCERLRSGLAAAGGRAADAKNAKGALDRPRPGGIPASVAAWPLVGIAEPGRRRELRRTLEEVLGGGWAIERAAALRLGDLAPGAGVLPDGPLVPGTCGPRLEGVLDRAGWNRWGTLLDRQLADVGALPNVGAATLAEVLGLCFERSLSGVAASAPGAGGAHEEDLDVVLRFERAAHVQPVTEALLGLRAGDAPAPVRRAADRLVRERAPWACALDGSLGVVIEAVGDDRSRALWRASTAWRTAVPSPQAMAEEHGVPARRAWELLRRAEWRARAALEASPGPLAWLVAGLRERLGPAASIEVVDAALSRLGVDAASEDVVVWLAGPYRPLRARPGWIAIDAQIVARTEACLSGDGGVRRLADVEGEIGFDAGTSGAWLRANHAAVVHDLAVMVTGSLPDALERVLDAHGRALPPAEIVACLSEGGRDETAARVGATARKPRFRRLPDGTIALADWSDQHREAPPARVGFRPAPLLPAPSRSTEAAAAEAPEVIDDRLWLWVRVDAQVLRGAEAPVPASLADGLGVTVPSRRVFSSRYGPVVVVHEGSHPVRGSVRALALAAGARIGDTLLLGFSKRGDVAVEVRPVSDQGPVRDGAALSTISGGAP